MKERRRKQSKKRKKPLCLTRSNVEMVFEKSISFFSFVPPVARECLLAQPGLGFSFWGVPLSSNDNYNDILWAPHCLNKDRIYNAPQSIKKWMLENINITIFITI